MKQITLTKLIKVLKSFLSWATEKDITQIVLKIQAKHDIDIVYLSF